MTAKRTSQKNTETPALDFEESLKQLTALIEKMESGQLTLNESLSCFEQGVSLIKQCQHVLTDAEQKIEILTRKTAKKNDEPA